MNSYQLVLTGLLRTSMYDIFYLYVVDGYEQLTVRINGIARHDSP